MFHQWLQWYQASGMSRATISIPGMEAIVLLVVLTICLLCRINRTGLVLAYIFTYRWGLLFGRQFFSDGPKVNPVFLASYIVFGILVLTLALAAMMITACSGSDDRHGRRE